MHEWRARLQDYHDTDLCNFLDYGWPVGYMAATLPTSTFKNHGSALAQPDLIQSYLDKECGLGATCGPFSANPLSTDLTISPLQIAHSRSGKSRVVVDLSFPSGSSVNDGIPKDSYLAEPLALRLPGTDALIAIILQKGPGCLLFKKDLSRAYRQLRIDPRDFHLLGVQHHGGIYFDVAPPFGLRSAAMMCQRTTSAVSHMFSNLGYQCTNYIDDFGGAESPSKATMAFETLEELFSILGLESSPEKDCAPSTCMVFLGVQFNTIDMTMSVTPERLLELLSRCRLLLTADSVSRRDLQSLLGVMSFVTACVRPARIFMSGLLNTLRTNPSARLCPLTSDDKSDLRWWCHFLPQFNGVTLIKSTPWLNNPFYLSTDACASGAGGYFQGQFFHTPFPGHILEQYGHDINILELLAVMVALKLWAPALRGQRFILNCDNKNCVLALNSGRSRTRAMQLCLREIWFLSAAFDFELAAHHIQGASNTLADHLSRWHLSPGHKAHFEALTADIPTVHVPCATDLFNFDVRI